MVRKINCTPLYNKGDIIIFLDAMQYSQFSVNDFVMDEHFQKWVLKPHPDVNSFWETWISQHPEKLALIDEAREIILLINFNRHTFPKEESLKIWTNINEKIKEHGKGKMHGPSTGVITHGLRFQYLRKIAAVFLGIMLISAVWFLLHVPYRMIEYTTGYGEIKTIILPDSSSVILNANSSLRYTSNWDKGGQNSSGKYLYSNIHRQVWLEGEAYFDVNKFISPEGNNINFVVHTPSIDIEVLGTKFNVNNRRGKTMVFLKSGSVKLNAHANMDDEIGALTMERGEVVEISDVGNHFIRKKENYNFNFSWINNELIFDEVPLGDIALVLEDNYGIDVVFKHSSVADKKLKGTFPADDIDVLLSTLSMSFDVKISHKKDKITFLK